MLCSKQLSQLNPGHICTHERYNSTFFCRNRKGNKQEGIQGGQKEAYLHSFLNPGQLHISSRFAPGKEPRWRIEQEAGWASEPVWTFRRREHLFSLPGCKPPDRPGLQLATTPTGLCRPKDYSLIDIRRSSWSAMAHTTTGRGKFSSVGDRP